MASSNGAAGSQKDENARQCFLLHYYPTPKSTSKALDPNVLEALDISAQRIQTFATPRDGCLALLSLGQRKRLEPLRRVLTGAAYNGVAYGGLRISGDGGLHIYTSNKAEDGKYEEYMKWIVQIKKNNTSVGVCAGDWKANAIGTASGEPQHSSSHDEQQRQWAMDDKVQQQVMLEDPGAFQISSIDMESGEYDVQDDGDKCQEEAQPQKKRARIAQQSNSDPSALGFAQKFMEFQRNDAENNADLRVKLAEMTYASKVEKLTERIQKAEARGLEAENLRIAMDANHAKEIAEYVRKLEDSERRLHETESRLNEKDADHAKEMQALASKVHKAVAKEQELVAKLTVSSTELATERLHNARLEGKVRAAIGDFVLELERIKGDFSDTANGIIRAIERLGFETYSRRVDAAMNKVYEDQLHKYNQPEWKYLEDRFDTLEVENRTLRAVIKAARDRGISLY